MIRTEGQWPDHGAGGPGDVGGREIHDGGPASDRGATVGVVVCGGRSRRMGRDKAPLAVGGRSMLGAVAEAFVGTADRVLLACGERERYGGLGFELVLDRVPDAGPMGGLEAALTRVTETRAGGAWLLVLACDMPRARGAVFEALLARARERNADACLLRSSGGLEPLYAVYHTRCLGAVRRALAAGERRMTSFHAGFGPLTVEVLDEVELPGDLADRECHRNVNTPRELAREREAHA